MTEPRPENDLEVTMRLVRSGELPSERLALALLEAELAVLVDGTPDPMAIEPFIVHRDDATYVPFMDTQARPAKLQTVDAETIRATWTWVRTSDGWFASSATVAPGERPGEFSLYDREGLSYRAVPAAEVLQVERVDSEGLYEGHWIPLVSTWKQDGTRVHAPVPRRGAGYSAMLYLYRSPDWDALVALPRAEVHDDRGSNGGVSFLVPFSELSDYRETVTPLGWTAEADGR